MDIGPAMDWFVATVILAVLLAFPRVRPVIAPGTVTFVIGHVKAEVKLLLGRTVSEPMQSMVTAPGVAITLPSMVTLLLEEVTLVPAFLPMTVVPANFTFSCIPVGFEPIMVMGPDTANKSP